MAQDIKTPATEKKVSTHIARMVLVAFLLTFVSARIVVFLIMFRSIPDLYLHLGGTHFHHLNYGIFLLSIIGGYLLFRSPTSRGLKLAAVAYGIGMALTFDEFGMWIHLGGSYWQRASWDAITVLAGLFGLIAFAPSLKRFRPHNWFTVVILIVAVLLFFIMLSKTLGYCSRTIQPRLQRIESSVPK